MTCALNKLHLLIAHCADLGVDVDWADLGGRRRGEYLDDEQRIILSNRLTYRQSLACMAHEVGHLIAGDRCSTPAVERAAWETGAAMIISPAEYAEAEAEVGHHVGALAVALEVTPKLIEAWRRWYWKRHAYEQHRLRLFDLGLLDDVDGDALDDDL